MQSAQMRFPTVAYPHVWQILRRWITCALLSLLLLLLIFPSVPVRGQDEPTVPPLEWASVDENGTLSVNLFYFYTPTCPYCRLAQPFVDSAAEAGSWLTVYKLDLSTHPEHAAFYQRVAAATGNQAQYVPAFVYCGEMIVGFDGEDTTGRQIMEQLEACYTSIEAAMTKTQAAEAEPPVATEAEPTSEQTETEAAALVIPPTEATGPSDTDTRAESAAPPVAQEDTEQLPVLRAAPSELAEAVSGLPGMATGPAESAADTRFSIPLIGVVDAQMLSLPMMTVILAGLDAFNPCAFFVLLFLLSMVIHAQSRLRMAVIGGVFVFFSGALYFIFMAAWLNVFLWFGELLVITLIAGVLALVFGFLNIKDYFFADRGPSLSIPQQAKPALFQRIRNLIHAGSWPAMLGSTVVLAIAANSYELLCTAGFPMVFTRVLTLHALPTPVYYAYLLAYSLIYVVPLTLIVALFTIRFSSRKLSENEGKILKLLSGLMMGLMGGILIVAPEWMSRVEVAGGLLAAALILTVAIHWLGNRTRPPKKPLHGAA